MASLTYSAQQLTPPSPISSARPMADTPFTLVDTRTALEGLCAAVRGCDAVAVDLEHHSLRSFQGFTCLMQVAHSSRGVLCRGWQRCRMYHPLRSFEVFTCLMCQ